MRRKIAFEDQCHAENFVDQLRTHYVQSITDYSYGVARSQLFWIITHHER